MMLVMGVKGFDEGSDTLLTNLDNLFGFGLGYNEDG